MRRGGAAAQNIFSIEAVIITKRLMTANLYCDGQFIIDMQQRIPYTPAH